MIAATSLRPPSFFRHCVCVCVSARAEFLLKINCFDCHSFPNFGPQLSPVATSSAKDLTGAVLFPPDLFPYHTTWMSQRFHMKTPRKSTARRPSAWSPPLTPLDLASFRCLSPSFRGSPRPPPPPPASTVPVCGITEQLKPCGYPFVFPRFTSCSSAALGMQPAQWSSFSSPFSFQSSARRSATPTTLCLTHPDDHHHLFSLPHSGQSSQTSRRACSRL